MAVKVHVEGPTVPPRVETVRHRRFTVGTDGAAAIVIHGDPRIAAHHVRIIPTGTGLELEPLAGDVRVGGELVTGPRASVAYGDTITIGQTRLRVERDPLYFVPAEWHRPPVPVPADRRADHDLQVELLAAIRDAPDDPAPRMVYADWLEAAGYLEEAEQLRHTTQLDVAAALQAEWQARPAAGAITGCCTLDCPGRLEQLASTRPPRCATCRKRVRACASTRDACAAIAAGEPFAVDPALPRVTAELVEAALRKAADSLWEVRRRTGEASWSVTQRRGRVLENAYEVVMIADRVELHYGGNDAGPFSLDDSPRHHTVELPLAGLDEAALFWWFVTALLQLPPSVIGYS